MKKRLGLTALLCCLISALWGADIPDQVYLMAYFKTEKLYYAYSYDSLKWTDINSGNPVFNAHNNSIRLRDPFIKRVTHDGETKFHLVHTKGWDNKQILHWESDDLINWESASGHQSSHQAELDVMGGTSSPNAWAPEFFYDEANAKYYVFWTSRNFDGVGRERILYTTTTDWINYAPPQVYFDPGFAVIDLTIAEKDGTYYGYYKRETGGHRDRHTLLATSSSLDPAVDAFSGTQDILPSVRGVEGPETIKLIGQDKWLLFYDFFAFGGYWGASRSDNLTDWSPLPKSEVSFPSGARHGSVEIISRDELTALLNHYGDPLPTGPLVDVLPTSEQSGQTWRYTTLTPSASWFETGFNDGAWSSGQGGFGTNGTPGAHVGTFWNGSDIWLRRTFTPEELTAEQVNNLRLRIHNDEDVTVYLNGVLAFSQTGYVTDYREVALTPAAILAFNNGGSNTLALHCRQTGGGQYVDAGLRTVAAADSFQEDFSDGNADGWTSYGGNWSVASQEYRQQDGVVKGPKALADGTAFADLVMEAEVSVSSGSKAWGNAGVIFRVSEPGNGADAYKGYYAGLRPGNNRIEVGKANGGSWTLLANPSVNLSYDQTYSLKVSAEGSTIKVYLDGTLVSTVQDSSFASGSVGVRSHCAAATFDDISVSEQ